APPRGARAEALPPDPVEELRKSLKVEVNLRDLSGEALRGVLLTRRKTLEAKAAKLKTLTDYSRALTLPEWRTRALPRGRAPAPDVQLGLIDQGIQVRIGAELIRGVQEVIRKGTPARQVAAANLIVDTINNTTTGLEGRRGLYDQLAPLAKDFTELARSPNAGVREAAVRALSQFPTLPNVVVPALERALTGRNPEAVRKEAAQSLDALVSVVSDRGSSRGIELSRRGMAPGGGATFLRGERIRVLARIVPAAARGLKDPSGAVRLASAGALREAS